MKLIFLGTGGYHPNERRHTACLLMPEIGVAFDAGTGFFRVQPRLQTRELDIFLTHAHLDHICGLTFFMVPMLSGDVDRVRVLGQPDVLCAVRKHLFAPELFPIEPDFEWCEFNHDFAMEVAHGGQLKWIGLDHPGGSVGYRIDWPDYSMAYITDTTAPGTYQPFIQNVDVLIHECYFPDSMQEWSHKTGHSSASAVAEVAKAAQVGALFLVHADPQNASDDPVGLTQIRSIFPKTTLAEDLMEIDLSEFAR
ncbi:MAG: MBL fold metallo-hydrolase [Fuerstiella sp.]